MTIKPGIYAAAMSIFNNDLTLDIDSTIKHAEKIIENGLHGVVIFGSTGMAQLISSNEKIGGNPPPNHIPNHPPNSVRPPGHTIGGSS